METNLLHPYFFKLVDTEGLLNNNQIPEIPFSKYAQTLFDIGFWRAQLL